VAQPQVKYENILILLPLYMLCFYFRLSKERLRSVSCLLFVCLVIVHTSINLILLHSEVLIFKQLLALQSVISQVSLQPADLY
jgi:hypothetical protein